MARPAKDAPEVAGAKTYRATATIYVDERYIVAGEVFTSAATPGKFWEEVAAPAVDEA